jgi:hypothetical protein
MAHVTLSLPDEIYEAMKRYPEVKWSEIVRQTIMSYLKEMQDTTSSAEVRHLLSEDTISRLRKISSAKMANHYRKSARKEWKRTKSLTQTS